MPAGTGGEGTCHPRARREDCQVIFCAQVENIVGMAPGGKSLGVNWKKEDKFAKWSQIEAKEKPPLLYSQWMKENKERLHSLSTDMIDIGDMAYWQELALMQEEDKLRQILNKLDEEEALASLVSDERTKDMTKEMFL